MPSRKRSPVIRGLIILGLVLSLVACLAAPVLFFLARLGDESYKAVLLGGSVGWFLFAAALTATNPGQTS